MWQIIGGVVIFLIGVLAGVIISNNYGWDGVLSIEGKRDDPAFNLRITRNIVDIYNKGSAIFKVDTNFADDTAPIMTNKSERSKK